MDSTDIVDEVNSLLKLRVGDPYRLEHIKQTYIQNQKIWITDENYLKRLREKYLAKHTSDIQTDDEIIFENELEDKETIHCWKCGKKGPLSANFCMICGTSLFEVGSNPQSIVETTVNHKKSVSLKIPLLVGIPVLILIILGAGYSMGYFDNALDSSPVSDSTIVFVDDDVKVVPSSLTDSKCGPGTIFDTVSNSCILE